MLPEGCAMCGQYGTNNFVVEDLPVGPRTFCTEKHFAQYAGLPVKESGYYGFEAEETPSRLQKAVISGLRKAKKDKLIEVKKSYLQVSQPIMEALSKLGTGKRGKVSAGVGEEIDPYDVVAALASGKYVEIPTSDSTSEDTIKISQMVSGYAQQANLMDKREKTEWERIEYTDKDYIITRRLGFKLGSIFGIYTRASETSLTLFGPPNTIRTMKMTFDVLLEDLKDEVRDLSDSKKSAFYQAFGIELQNSTSMRIEQKEAIREWANEKYGSTTKIVPVKVSSEIKEKAQKAVKKLNPFNAESFESETFEATAYSMIEHQDDNCLEEIADSLRPKYGLEYNEGVLEWGFGYKSGDVTLYIYDGEGRQLDIITYDREALVKALKEQGHKNPESWGAESFESEGELERKYFARFGDERGGKEWGEYNFTWFNDVGDWKPIDKDTTGWDEDDYDSFRDNKEYDLVNQMLDNPKSSLYGKIENNTTYTQEEEFDTTYKVLNEDGDVVTLNLLMSWDEPEIEQQKIQYYDKEPLLNLEFLAESFEAPMKGAQPPRNKYEDALVLDKRHTSAIRTALKEKYKDFKFGVKKNGNTIIIINLISGKGEITDWDSMETEINNLAIDTIWEMERADDYYVYFDTKDEMEISVYSFLGAFGNKEYIVKNAETFEADDEEGEWQRLKKIIKSKHPMGEVICGGCGKKQYKRGTPGKMVRPNSLAEWDNVKKRYKGEYPHRFGGQICSSCDFALCKDCYPIGLEEYDKNGKENHSKFFIRIGDNEGAERWMQNTIFCDDCFEDPVGSQIIDGEHDGDAEEAIEEWDAWLNQVGYAPTNWKRKNKGWSAESYSAETFEAEFDFIHCSNCLFSKTGLNRCEVCNTEFVCRSQHGEDCNCYLFTAESKKINPIEKAGLTGVASGATMEGLETLLAAEGQDSDESCHICGTGEQIEHIIDCEVCKEPFCRKRCYGCGVCDAICERCEGQCPTHINPNEIMEYDEENPLPFPPRSKRHGEDFCEYYWERGASCKHCQNKETQYWDDDDYAANAQTKAKKDWQQYRVWKNAKVKREKFIRRAEGLESFSAEEGIYEVITQQQVDDEMECDGCPQFIFKVGDSYAKDGDLSFCITCAKDFKTCIDCDETYDPEGEHKWSKTCSYCRGSGFIETSYTPATYDDPAEMDGDDCEACDGLGYVCEEGEGYGAESYSAEGDDDLDIHSGSYHGIKNRSYDGVKYIRQGNLLKCKCGYEQNFAYPFGCYSCGPEAHSGKGHIVGFTPNGRIVWKDECTGRFMVDTYEETDVGWFNSGHQCKEAESFSAEQKSISPYLLGIGIVGILGYAFRRKLY